MKYCIKSLDVWGNEEDGYEINQEFVAGSVELPEYPSENEVLEALKAEGLLKESVKLSQLEISDARGYLEVSDAKDHRPVFILGCDENH